MSKHILILSPWVYPNDVGEAWSNFQWIKGLAENNNLTVLYLKSPDQKELKELIPNINTHYWNDYRYPKSLQRFKSMLKPDYIRYFFLCRQWIKIQLKKGYKFDFIHHLSPLALRYPSPAVGLHIPFIIGPLGGSLNSPALFSDKNGKSPWYTKFRNTDNWRLSHDPLLKNTYKECKMVIGVAPYIKDILHPINVQKFRLMSETGCHSVSQKRSIPTSTIKLLYVGRIIRTKGLRDLIHAIAMLNDLKNKVSLDVLGKGEDLDFCQKECERLDLSHIITFHGQQPKETVKEFYANAHIFAFPSFREPSGNVVFEAMSHGLAMIVANRGGPGYVVKDDFGIKIPVENPQQFISDICKALTFFIHHPESIITYGQNSLKEIQAHHLWPKKIEKMNEYYEEVFNDVLNN